jgi:transglutaminase-like putative cysteine protease
MNLERLETRLSFALVFTAIVAHCVAQHALWLVLVAGALAVGSRYVCDGPRGLTLPRPISLLLTGIALVFATIGLLADPQQAMAWIGNFVVWLTVIKLYERRSIENEAERLILGLLLMVLGALISVDLLFGLLLVVWTGLGIAVLLMFQLYYGQELVRSERRAVVSIDALPPSMSRPVCGLGVRRAFRRMSGVMFAIVLMVSAAMFITFPRGWTGGLARAASGQGGPAESGFTSMVDLTSTTRINESLAEVLTVALLDGSNQPIQPDGPIRLRGATLDRYRGDGIWEPSSRARADWRNDLESDEWHTLQTTRPFELDSDRVIVQQIDLTTPLDTLFSMSVPLAIRTPVPIALEYNSYTQVLEVTGEIAPLRYEIRVLPGPPQGLPARLTWDRYQNEGVADEARRLLADAGLPERRPRTPAEATAWTLEASALFSRHLSRDGFRYSLDLSHLSRQQFEDQDPVERFLLVDRTGHCEFFAAALVAMCHTVDINARMVTGFVSDRFDPLTNRYVVLEADAHAWVEVEAMPGDWRTFDPTPPAFTPDARSTEAGFTQRLQWIYRWLEGGWRSSILGFDESSQVDAVRRWMPWWSAAGSSILRWLTDSLVTINLAFGFAGVGYIWMGVVLLLVAMAVFIWRRARARRRRVLARVSCGDISGRDARRLERELGFYVDMLDLLAAAGLTKPRWQPPCAFADALSTTHPETAACVRRLSRRFYEIRFGARPEDAGATDEQLDALTTALEREQ